MQIKLHLPNSLHWYDLIVVLFSAVLGFHGMLNQTQFYASENDEKVETGGFTGKISESPSNGEIHMEFAWFAIIKEFSKVSDAGHKCMSETYMYYS